MSEEALHIDTHGASQEESNPVETEHNPEEISKDQKSTTTSDPETQSEDTEESQSSDDSDNVVHDLSPTTPTSPEHHMNIPEKSEENPTEPQPAESESSVEKLSEEPSISAGTDTKAEHVNEEPVDESPVQASTEIEHSGERSTQDSSSPEVSKEEENQDQLFSNQGETEHSIEDATSHHATSITAESERPEEEKSEEEEQEKTQETPDSSIVEAEDASKQIPSDPSHSAKFEPDTTPKEETGELPRASEENPEASANTSLPELNFRAPVEPEPAVETTAQESQDPSKLQEPAAGSIQTPEASKEPSKPTPSDREKQAVDTVKRYRIQFRVALDVFLQLINENEDDEGTVRLNLVERNSDLRKTVGMLGLRLKSLADAEKELDWVQLLDRYEAKKEQE